MYEYYNNRFRRNIIDISPGEYIVSGDDVLISTVLGSCVSVCIFDPSRKLGGMNHFMLVEGRNMENVGELMRYERYGSYAIETLINEFLRTGSVKSELQAKVFGGGRILKTDKGSAMDIGAQNIIYALNFLKNEEIPILAEDTGGEMPRRIFLYPRTFKVFMKRERNTLQDEPVKAKPLPDKSGRVILFDQEPPLG